MKSSAEEALRQGDPALALNELQGAVRREPGDAALRIFLFQLLCVVGHWERALTQLELCAELDAAALPMRETYGPAIRCEMLRAEVFKGRRSPMLFGEPELWVAQLIEALIRAGNGDEPAARQFRLDAFEAAPLTGGLLNGERFSWIADADSRLGPILECIVNGRYYWVPFARLSMMTVEQPVDLRDVVWLPAHLHFLNGGETVALLPARYPDSEKSTDGAIALGRRTIWEEGLPDVYAGLGQRVLTTDVAELGISELQTLTFDVAEAAHG